MQTIEAIIDKDGKVRLLKNVRLPKARREIEINKNPIF